MHELEFVPSWYPRMRRRQQLLKLQATFTVAAVILLGAWILNARTGISAQRSVRAALDNRLSQSSEELALLEEQVDLKAQLQKQKEIMDRLGRHVEASRMLSLLQQSLTKQVAVLDLKISTIESVQQRVSKDPNVRDDSSLERRQQVNVVGVAPSDLDISEFLEKLAKVRFCENVQLLEASDMSRDGHLLRKFEVVFSINLSQGGNSW